MALVLASQSPRRRELMRLVRADFDVCTANFDEAAIQGLPPAQTAAALAAGKAQAAAQTRPAGDIVLGCDTVVELDGALLGKPQGRAGAVAMLSALSGREHLVHTGLCLLRAGAAAEPLRHVETTRVLFAAIPAADIEAVADTPEPYDKAGGYGIQGWAARFVPRIAGCYYNVMGLPVAAVHALLCQFDESAGQP